MPSERKSKRLGALAVLPLLLGITGIAANTVYDFQRFGFFLNSFFSLDRFIQHHLDAIGGVASCAEILGLLSGLLILRIKGRDRLVTVGTVVSVLGFLFGMLATPL